VTAHSRPAAQRPRPARGLRAWLPALLLALAATLGAAAPAAADPGVLVLGRISDDPRAHHDQLQALLDYVVPRMRDVGIREGRVLMARDPAQMQSYMRRGRVDWVTETASMGMILADRAGAEPLVLTERGGSSRYRTVFFARRDSGIASLADLPGRSIALQNASSTSAYFVPMLELLDAGHRPLLLLSPEDRPAAGEVGYVFARTEINIATWVHKRLVDVGAMSELDWAQLERMPESFRADMQVIHASEPVPRAMELVRPDLDSRVRARLREVLLDAAGDPEAGDALRAFFRTTRFLPIDDATATGLERLREGARRVRLEVE
jgi:phosphonate transport system substrate-binding protein